MSKLRSECRNNARQYPLLPDKDAWFSVWRAVAKRRSLAHGALHKNDQHCAIGCFWEEAPRIALSSSFIDQVAAVNDANPKETPHQRWKRVNAWLKWKVANL